MRLITTLCLAGLVVVPIAASGTAPAAESPELTATPEGEGPLAPEVESPVQLDLDPEPMAELGDTSCTTSAGNPGYLLCTGSLCYDGSKCAQCCDSSTHECDSLLQCVDMCFE